jgi:electron transfer flavoprotein alpha/beta subunit
MHIVVCIKQVPETSDVEWDSTTGSLLREGVEGILNPNDKNALEAALQIRENHGGEITALSMGPRQAEEVLREALSMGVDKAILLSDGVFAGSDTLSTSYILHRAIQKISPCDLILCGKESWDAMTAHIGPQLSELLNLPQLTYAIEITIRKNSVRIKQKMGDGFRLLESPFPALITVEKDINQPRILSMDSIMNAYRDKEVHVWTYEDLEEDITHFGLKGSPTQSRRVYIKKVQKGNVTMLEGKPDEVARNLIQLLKQKGLF